jgi:alkanesulfonate monooxygenase SsuD/methylene tetrahydromethanopterin reductase-like flavin-dependent oxidoreductase (luciferase family)
MDFGLVVMGYHGCGEDMAFAEQHGFATAGFVDSPLLVADPFVCMALAAQATQRMRVGTMLAIPGLRRAPTNAAAIATVNRLAPGRVFLGLGSGFTGRAVFGLPRVSAAVLRDHALECRALLDGSEVRHRWGRFEAPIRFRHVEGRHIDFDHRIPVYVAADGPKALAVAGQSADGLIVSMMYANVMENAPEVFADSLAQVRAAADAADRSAPDFYTMWSISMCVLGEGESAVSPRALERIGAGAMMPFHAYADDPSIAEDLPPPIRDRLDVYEREVLARFPVDRTRLHQETHRGHLSHLLEGEAAALTEEIVRMTTLTGTAEEIAAVLRRMEPAGLRNVSFPIPPHLTRDVIVEFETRVRPLLDGGSAGGR